MNKILAFRKKFFSGDLAKFAYAISNMPILHVEDVIVSVYCWALKDEKTQSELIEKYFNHLKEKRNPNESIQRTSQAPPLNFNAMRERKDGNAKIRYTD